MTTPEELWRAKGDQEVFAALQKSLSDFTEAGQKVILAEAARRQPMWTCESCSEQNEDQFDACWHCGLNRQGLALATTDGDRGTVPPADDELAIDEAKGIPTGEVPTPALSHLGESPPSAPASLRYKVVPFNAAISNSQDPGHLASQIENIISHHASNGWAYVGVHQLQTFKAGSSGCFGLGATPPESITTEFIVFRR